MVLDRKIVAAIEKENNIDLETHIKKISPPLTRINKSQKNNYVNLTITIPFKKVDKAPDQFDKFLGKNRINRISLKQEDRIFAVTYDLKEELSLEKDFFDSFITGLSGADTDSLKIEYWTKVPGEIRETSGTPITADKAIWKLKVGKTYKIRTKSILIRWWLVAFTGIGILTIVGLMGATIINVRSRREQI